MLTRHDPEKVKLVGKLLAKYQNREEYLVRKLAGRYKVNNIIEEEPEQENNASESIPIENNYDTNENKSEDEVKATEDEEEDEGGIMHRSNPSQGFDNYEVASEVNDGDDQFRRATFQQDDFQHENESDDQADNNNIEC
jgi:hypothetical protein